MHVFILRNSHMHVLHWFSLKLYMYIAFFCGKYMYITCWAINFFMLLRSSQFIQTAMHVSDPGGGRRTASGERRQQAAAMASQEQRGVWQTATAARVNDARRMRKTTTGSTSSPCNTCEIERFRALRVRQIQWPMRDWPKVLAGAPAPSGGLRARHSPCESGPPPSRYRLAPHY